MQINVNFSQVEERGPVEPGLYDVKVVNVEVKESSRGNEMVILHLQITSKGEYKGRTLTDRLVLSDGSMWRVYNALSALLGPQPREDFTLDTNTLIGATGQAHITNRVWAVEDGGDGQSRPQVSAWIVPDTKEILSDEDLPF